MPGAPSTHTVEIIHRQHIDDGLLDAVDKLARIQLATRFVAAQVHQHIDHHLTGAMVGVLTQDDHFDSFKRGMIECRKKFSSRGINNFFLRQLSL